MPTMLLSHHPGHRGAQGAPVEAGLLNRMLDGLLAHGCFRRCQAVLSGYLGLADTAASVLRAVELAKAGTPGAVYLCDPVLGDDGRLYVNGDIVAAMHNLAVKSDIITPNAFELAVLSGRECNTQDDAWQAMRILQSHGPNIVVLSSFAGADTAAGTLSMLALDGPAAWRLTIPEIRQKFHGAGDLFAALFLDAWLERRDTGEALGGACARVQAVLARTAARHADELQLIEAQDLLSAPQLHFQPERIS